MRAWKRTMAMLQTLFGDRQDCKGIVINPRSVLRLHIEKEVSLTDFALSRRQQAISCDA